jgi:hypothetical protein
MFYSFHFQEILGLLVPSVPLQTHMADKEESFIKLPAA